MVSDAFPEATLLSSVLDGIQREEVSELALALAELESPSGAEHRVSDHLFDWCRRVGFRTRRLRAHPSLAANLLAVWPGTGGGRSLLFNSHLDVLAPVAGDPYFRDPDAPDLHGGRRRDGTVVGVGVVNDKGPMAAWLVAAAAIAQAGVRLPGDLMLSMVTGEIGYEPVDELDGPEHHGKDFGARYLATHGGVADAVLVAETTGFHPLWVEPGKAFFAIRVEGAPRGLYTPYLARPYPEWEHPNAIVRAGRLLPALEAWAEAYERRSRRRFQGGVVAPKVNLGAIRAGDPARPIMTPAHCSLYLDVRIPPGSSPLDVREELRAVMAEAAVEGEVELYLYRQGCQAEGAELLLDAIGAALAAEGIAPTEPAPETASSMWRDLNVWNEMGFPAVTCGPGAGTGAGGAEIAEGDLFRAARLYARIALAVCGSPRSDGATPSDGT